MSEAYRWLVEAGLWRDLLAASVGVAVGHVFAWRPLRKIARQHAEQQAKIADLLNTDSPGGLAEVVREIRKGKSS